MNPGKATSLCHSCPKLCRFSCPVAAADQNESTTPWGKMSAMQLTETGAIPFDSSTASLAYKCLNCRASQTVCELGNPVSETLDFYRAKAFQQGVAPAPIYQYVKRFQDHNNPFKDLTKLDLLPQQRSKDATTVYFPGCVELRYFPETIERTLKLFRRSGMKLGLYRDPIPCCGYPLYLAGDLENFQELAEVNSQVLKKYREVITGNPGCLYTMETLYRSMGQTIPTRFFHVVERLLPHPQPLSRIRERVAAGQVRAVAYHDPCLLGRYRGTYDPPRRLIETVTGKKPLEFFRNRSQSYCSGAGGLLPVSSPETAKKITETRLEEFQRTGATTLVSACPTCVHRFKKIAPNLKVMNLIHLLG